MMRWIIRIAIVAIIIYFIRFAPSGHGRYAQGREKVAQSLRSGREIVVAVVWPETGEKSFGQGADLAAKEIAEAGGIVVGRQGNADVRRPLRLRRFDEFDHAAGMAIAHSIATDVNIVGVVGHDVKNEAIIKASSIYNKSGTLFIVPTSLDEAVTLHNFENVFRLAPTFSKVGKAIADSVPLLMETQQIRVAILYPSDLQPIKAHVGSKQNVAQRLLSSANNVLDQHGIAATIKVAFANSYQRGKDDYYADIEPFLFRHDQYDVVLILDVMPSLANVRRDLELGLDSLAAGKTRHDKQILDLEQLDWSLSELSYAELAMQESSDRATATVPQVSDLESNRTAEPDPQASDILFERAAEMVLRETKQNVAVLTQRDPYNGFYGIQLSPQILNSINAPATGLRGRDQFVNRVQVPFIRTFEQPRTVKDHSFVPASIRKAMRFFWTAERPADPDYSELVFEVAHNRVKFVLIAGMGEPAIRLIKQLRKAGLTAPIICGPHLEYQVLREMELEESKNIYVVSAFHSDDASPKVREFIADYKAEYGIEPDALAAAGYQSIKLLENAFRLSGSTSLKGAISALLFSDDLDEGPFGKPRFSRNGDLQGIRLVLKTRTKDGSVKVIDLDTTFPIRLE